MEIPEIPKIGIRNIKIQEVPVRPSYLNIEVPGCTYQHRDQNLQQQLLITDPGGVYTNCPGGAGIPSFYPMDWNPKDIKVIEEKPVANNEPPPPPETKTERPTIPEIEKEDVECPDPNKNNPRIGDIAANGKEKVSGFELSSDGQTCIVVYEPIGAVEKYLPAPSTVTTTSVIASAAVVSSVLAKPLADLILKIIKPSVKKLITTAQTKIFRKPPKVVSYREKLMEQRERNRAYRKLKKGW